MTVRIDNSGVDKFGEAFPVIFAILVILMLVVIAANFILRTKDDSKEAIRRKVKILEKQSNAGAEWYIVECENGERLRLRNFQGYKVFITVGDEGILEYKGLTIKSEYYGAAEPPVRCGESHLSGLTEPPHFIY